MITAIIVLVLIFTVHKSTTAIKMIRLTKVTRTETSTATSKIII